MKLDYIHVNGYKNLSGASLEFHTNETPITIIGNNGTGKSNLIEALLHIFVGLYFGKPAEFEFHIRYEAHNKQVEVKYSFLDQRYTFTVDGIAWSQTQFNRRIRNPQQMPPFPSQIFSYYSGTCKRVENIIKKYDRSYLSKLKKQSDDLERQFVFSDINQAEWILLGLVAHQHFDLLNELEIEELHDVRLTIQPPESYVHDQDDPVVWGTEGGIREFLAALNNVTEVITTQHVRTGRNDNRDVKVFRLNTNQLQRLGLALGKRGTNIYGMLQALAAKQMLLKTDFEVVQRETRFCYPPDSMSEGEKQLVCVVGGLTLAKNIECLVLLDEPDTHLNPSWSWRYNNLLKQALTSQQRTTSTTIMATHDPIMISGLTREQVFIARKDGRRLTYDPPVRDPRGQGVANVLVSEYFGLPSSLDENTQLLLDERLRLAYKQERLTNVESVRLAEINSQLDMLGLSISFRDPAYKEFEEQKFGELVGRRV